MTRAMPVSTDSFQPGRPIIGGSGLALVPMRVLMRWLASGQPAATVPRAPPVADKRPTGVPSEHSAPVAPTAPAPGTAPQWSVSHTYRLPLQRATLKRPKFEISTPAVPQEFRLSGPVTVQPPPPLPDVVHPDPAASSAERPVDRVAAAAAPPPEPVLQDQPILPPALLVPVEDGSDALYLSDDALTPPVRAWGDDPFEIHPGGPEPPAPAVRRPRGTAPPSAERSKPVMVRRLDGPFLALALRAAVLLSALALLVLFAVGLASSL